MLRCSKGPLVSETSLSLLAGDSTRRLDSEATLEWTRKPLPDSLPAGFGKFECWHISSRLRLLCPTASGLDASKKVSSEGKKGRLGEGLCGKLGFETPVCFARLQPATVQSWPAPPRRFRSRELSLRLSLPCGLFAAMPWRSNIDEIRSCTSCAHAY